MDRFRVRATKTDEYLCTIKFDTVTNEISDMTCTPMSEMCCKGGKKDVPHVQKSKQFKTSNKKQ
jgi:hypothetical protein